MSKYYNKELPITVNVIYGGRRAGVTYRETEKLKRENEELERAWEDATKSWERQVKKVGKAIKFVEENYPTSTIGYQDEKDKLLKILKGE